MNRRKNQSMSSEAAALAPVFSLWHGDMHPWRPMGIGCRPRAEIAAEIAARFGLTVAELMEPTRSRRASWPRMVAIAAMRAHGWSHGRCAGFFGLKDHTTSIHACRRVAAGLLPLALAAVGTMGD